MIGSISLRNSQASFLEEQDKLRPPEMGAGVGTLTGTGGRVGTFFVGAFVGLTPPLLMIVISAQFQNCSGQTLLLPPSLGYGGSHEFSPGDQYPSANFFPWLFLPPKYSEYPGGEQLT